MLTHSDHLNKNISRLTHLRLASTFEFPNSTLTRQQWFGSQLHRQNRRMRCQHRAKLFCVMNCIDFFTELIICIQHCLQHQHCIQLDGRGDQVNGGHGASSEENTVTCNETGLTSVGHVARSSSEARESMKTGQNVTVQTDSEISWVLREIWHDSLNSLSCNTLGCVYWCAYAYINIRLTYERTDVRR